MDNNVQGEPQVFLQDYCHVDGDVWRHVRLGSGAVRSELAHQLHVLGCSAHLVGAEGDKRLQIDANLEMRRAIPLRNLILPHNTSLVYTIAISQV
jgi:hypothetical protein